MPPDVDSLRAELARRFQTLLPPNDPIFLAVALNDMVLEGYLSQVQELMVKANAETAAAMAHHLDVAKEASAQLITQTAQYVAEEVRGQIIEERERSARLLDQIAQRAEKASRATFWAASVSILLTGFALGATLAKLYTH